MWGRGQRGNYAACSALSRFQSLPPLPTSKLGPSGTDSWTGGSVHVLGPHGSLQWTLLWGWEFLPLPQPPQVVTARGFEAFFPILETCVVWSVSLPGCSSWFMLTQMWDHQPPLCHASSLPGCPSPPLLSVWMNVSSLTPWLSNFHTVRFSRSSGCFLFLNLLLSFAWLWEEAKCIYLCLHLG